MYTTHQAFQYKKSAHRCKTNFCDFFVIFVGLTGSRMFSMPLTERHVKKFHSNRIFSTVIFENLPQLTIQISYFIARQDTDIVAVLAFLSSITSIFISLIDVFSTMSLSKAIKHAKKDGYFQIETYFFDLTGSTVVKNYRSFQMKPNAMRKIFAEILECDIHCVECNLILKTENGLQYGFTVFSLSAHDKKTSGRLNRFLRIYGSVCNDELTSNTLNQDAFLARIIAEFGDNSPEIDISISNIVTLYDDKNKYASKFDDDYNAITQSQFYHRHSSMFSFDNVGVYKSITINAADGDAETTLAQPQNQTEFEAETEAKVQAQPVQTTDPAEDSDLSSASDEIFLEDNDPSQEPGPRMTTLSVHLSHLDTAQKKNKQDDLALRNDFANTNRMDWMKNIHEHVMNDVNEDDDENSILKLGFKLNMPQILTKYSSHGNDNAGDMNVNKLETKATEMAVDIVRSRSATM